MQLCIICTPHFGPENLWKNVVQVYNKHQDFWQNCQEKNYEKSDVLKILLMQILKILKKS